MFILIQYNVTLTTSAKTQFPNKVIFTGIGVRIQYIFGGWGHNSTHNRAQSLFTIHIQVEDQMPGSREGMGKWGRTGHREEALRIRCAPVSIHTSWYAVTVRKKCFLSSLPLCWGSGSFFSKGHCVLLLVTHSFSDYTEARSQAKKYKICFPSPGAPSQGGKVAVPVVIWIP